MAELTTDARHILARLELLMHGKTASLDSSGGVADRNPVPQGEARPLADQWRRIFHLCADHELPSLIEKAQKELQSILRRDPATLQGIEEEPRDAWEKRLIEDGEGFEARHVATSFRTSIDTVVKLRRREHRDPNLGHHLTQLPGESIRQMAARTGLSKSAVDRLLRASD